MNFPTLMTARVMVPRPISCASSQALTERGAQAPLS